MRTVFSRAVSRSLQPCWGSTGTVVGKGKETAWISFPSVVAAVTVKDLPLFPNGIALGSGPQALLSLELGAPVFFSPRGLEGGGMQVLFGDQGPSWWDPRVPPRDSGAKRQRAHLLASRFPSSLPPPLEHALLRRDPKKGARARSFLSGKGEGLTPQGDDLVAGTAACLFAFASAFEFSQEEAARWQEALTPLPGETTPLALTLGEMAARGEVLEPVKGLLDPCDLRWEGHAARLLKLGHSTGKAYLEAIGGCCRVLEEALSKEVGG